ncbi:MAG: outer membrane protein transport protein [Methylocystis sp.]|nr:outer membrane protein transport protein [Methylocystis sp.]
MNHFFRATILAASAMICVGATETMAADAITLAGYGPRQRALSGADVADSRDAMAMSVNPAGIVGLARQFQFGLTALMPERGYNATNTIVLAPGDARSTRPLFPVPNGAYLAPIDAESAWGAVAYGNGGINTGYDFGHLHPAHPGLGGPFGGGFAGIDLQQGFFSLVYARSFGDFSIGVAPTVAVQMMNVQGLKTLAALSSDMNALSDNGYDYSAGGGIRLGFEWRITDRFRFGISGSTPMFMTPFNKYRGVIANRGEFNIPANIVAGFAYDVTPNLTVMVDWRHIFYSLETLGNPSFPIMPRSLGTYNFAPGFAFRDTDAQAIGAEWRVRDDLTLRAGYRHSSAPYGSRDVTLNIFAPAIIAHQVSGGFNFKLTKNSSLDFAIAYGFKNTISGPEALPFLFVGGFPVLPQYNYAANISTWLRGTEVSFGYNYKFDAGDSSWLPTHF